MISRLSGTVVFTDTKKAVIDVGGVGYSVMTYSPLTLNEEVTLWTHLAVRDDALDLYGFTLHEELEIFHLLLSVSGIGPKTALGILSSASLSLIAQAIIMSDSSILIKKAGIGRKNAEKIVLELRDKLPQHLHVHAKSADGDTSGAHYDSDAVEALQSLGFSAEDARAALKSIDQAHKTSGARVKAALKILGK